MVTTNAVDIVKADDRSNAVGGAGQRRYWIALLDRIALPVLENLSRRRLREAMPIESKFGADDRHDRANCTHLEAFGRLLVGMAPWLESPAEDPDEEALRLRYVALARESIDAATDPLSPDRMNFGAKLPGINDHGRNQALVDTAFLAQAVLRAPNELWEKLPRTVKANLADAFKESRQILPAECNWLLFTATVEAALARMGEEWDPLRVGYPIRQHERWYVGDGTYGDGPQLHWDYYNSFVIQPMILDILSELDKGDSGKYGIRPSTALRRAQRFADVLERMISPEGTIPPIGRSLTYRMAALQTLAHVALLDQLPDHLAPSQVRCAMTAVIKRLMSAPGTFDREGWLKIGFAGAQPGLGEPYISTGSLYLCSVALLPLGLPSSHRFWSDPSSAWTSQKIYSGEDLPSDHAL